MEQQKSKSTQQRSETYWDTLYLVEQVDGGAADGVLRSKGVGRLRGGEGSDLLEAGEEAGEPGQSVVGDGLAAEGRDRVGGGSGGSGYGGGACVQGGQMADIIHFSAKRSRATVQSFKLEGSNAYRVTHEVGPDLLLTSQQKKRFSISSLY